MYSKKEIFFIILGIICCWPVGILYWLHLRNNRYNVEFQERKTKIVEEQEKQKRARMDTWDYRQKVREELRQQIQRELKQEAIKKEAEKIKQEQYYDEIRRAAEILAKRS